MTNREYMITLLNCRGLFDDGGASYESLIYHHIACPYFATDKRGYCCTTKQSRDLCFKCKEEWLDNEVDE